MSVEASKYRGALALILTMAKDFAWAWCSHFTRMHDFAIGTARFERTECHRAAQVQL